jgi:hypothetical protein
VSELRQRHEERKDCECGLIHCEAQRADIDRLLEIIAEKDAEIAVAVDTAE